MKRNLLCLFVFFVSALFACEGPMLMIRSKAVLKDGSSLMVYCMLPDDTSWKTSPFRDYEALKMQDGMDYLPAILAPEGGYDEAMNYFMFDSACGSIQYVKDYIRLPWGYYYSLDAINSFKTADLDSLLYMSAGLPLEFRMSCYWDYLNDKELKLLQSRFCDIDYAEGPMGDLIYVSTRDSISSDELELYTLNENCGGDGEKKSYETSFFYNTAGNRGWLKMEQTQYKLKESVFYRSMVESLQYNKARLQTLIPLVERNVAMPDDFKLTLKQEIKTATDDIDLLITYLNMPKKHTRPAKQLFAQITARIKDKKAEGYPPGDKLWNAYARILLPRLTNSFFIEDYTETQSKDLDAALADLGIVMLFGFY